MLWKDMTGWATNIRTGHCYKFEKYTNDTWIYMICIFIWSYYIFYVWCVPRAVDYMQYHQMSGLTREVSNILPVPEVDGIQTTSLSRAWFVADSAWRSWSLPTICTKRWTFRSRFRTKQKQLMIFVCILLLSCSSFHRSLRCGSFSRTVVSVEKHW